MKRMLFVTLMSLAISTGSFARKFVAEGRTYSALGDYRIEIADNPLAINGKEFKAFVISYNKSDIEITVAVQKMKNSVRYIVISDALSIQYVCHGKYFGVELLDNSLEKEGYITSPAALNRTEYFHQKAIATGESCELDYTRLIATYFPGLLNNSENILAAE
jgi:hypothetical protein